MSAGVIMFSYDVSEPHNTCSSVHESAPECRLSARTSGSGEDRSEAEDEPGEKEAVEAEEAVDEEEEKEEAEVAEDGKCFASRRSCARSVAMCALTGAHACCE
jgi:hypothetical protein